MKRFWLLALLAVSGVAHADTGSLPNGATLSWPADRLFIHEGNSKEPVLPKTVPDSLLKYFNMAHCECSQATHNDPAPTNKVTGEAFYEGEIDPELQLIPGTGTFSLPVDFWTGTQCDNDVLRDQNCILVSQIADLNSLSTTGYRQQIPVQLYDLMQPQRDAVTGVRPGCQPVSGSDPLWALARTMGTQMYDYSKTTTYNVDTWAPCAPTEFTVSAAENAIELKWTPSTTNVSDIAYYQALCAEVPDPTNPNLDKPAFASPKFSPRYQTSLELCGIADQTAILNHVQIGPDGKGTANIACNGTGSSNPIDAGVDASALTFAGSDAAIDAPDDAGIDAPPDADVDADMGPDAGTAGVSDSVFAGLDPAFICGQATSSSAASMRIEGLTNGKQYKVALLVMDRSFNARAVFFDTLITPHAVTDFWEDLHSNGSHVDGGFCLIAETYGDDNPLTNLLRRFRDDTLGGSGFGRALTGAYYATIGKLGANVHGHVALRIISGILLVPLVVIALLWHFLTLPGLLLLVLAAVLNRRRMLRIRRRTRIQLAQASAAALVLLVATRAHAQAPYWEDPSHTDTTTAAEDFGAVATVKWHVGVRLGPYVPGIDDQVGTKNSAGKGPYQAMFGGYNLMPMIDVDRVLWDQIGQLGVGISVGYLGKQAKAFQTTPYSFAPDLVPRSEGDTTSFRMIPIAVSAVYRFTYLDDAYGIPVFPYARAGLGYYVWWSTAPSGDFAVVCKNGGMPPCDETKAAGASAGFVGSIGLSIRAERVDAAAARSMRESGIQHAGFYGELSLGKVDGFGSDTKLSVGDTTWFAGAEFEF
jgi:hypothetical protein